MHYGYGVRFCPTEEELIEQYLCNRVCGRQLAYEGVVVDCEIYNTPPHHLFHGSPEKALYFFTILKRKTPNGARFDRRVLLCSPGDSNNSGVVGTWHGENNKSVMNANGVEIAFKRSFFYRTSKESSLSSSPSYCNFRYIMTEYSLNPTSYGLDPNMNNNIVLCKIKRKALNKKSSCVLGASTTFIQPVSVHAPTQQQPAAASNFYGCPPEATFQFGAPNLPFDFPNCGVPYNQCTPGGGGGGSSGIIDGNGGGGVVQQQQQQQQQQQSVYVTTSTTSTVVGDYVDTIGGGATAGEIIGRMDWDKDFGHDDDTAAAAQLKSTNVEDDNLVEDDSWTEYINMIDDSLAQHQTAPHNNNNNNNNNNNDNNYCYSESSPNRMMNNEGGSLDQPQQQQPQPSVEGSLDDDDDDDQLIAQINNTSRHRLA